jgi:predicted RNA-binding protein
MDSGQDLVSALKTQRILLSDTVQAMKVVGRQLAESERVYRIALCKKILEERDKGTPVTIISDVCRGDEKIAELKFRRDVKQSDYTVCLEKIQQVKIEIRILEGEIKSDMQNVY